MQYTTAIESPVPPIAHEWPWFRRLLLGYVRRELPAWGKFYTWLGGDTDSLWQHAGLQPVVGKWHGHTLRCDVGNWSERLTWFLGRYHDLPIQVLLQQVLRPGDCFVDIGANIGLLTALASHCVGAAGSVIACEPNPRLVARLTSLVQDNHLTTVQIVPKALGEARGHATLREFSGHSGWGSLASVGPPGAPVTATFDVDVVPGDEVLAQVPPERPMILKIDVEGHEVPVLRGLSATLRQRRPLVIAEVGEAHQARGGSTGEALRAVFADHHYRGFVIGYGRALSGRRTLRVRPLRPVEPVEYDVLFVPDDGALAARALPWLPRP